MHSSTTDNARAAAAEAGVPARAPARDFADAKSQGNDSVSARREPNEIHRPRSRRPGAQRELLLSVLRSPSAMADLSLRQWDLLWRQARQTGLASRLAVQVEELGIKAHIPPELHPHLESALVLARRHESVVRWEFNRIGYALREVTGPLVLLKGAAYLAAGYQNSKGRVYSDVDLLVPAEQLSEVEAKLKAEGWRTGLIDPRDARYFRTWLHELPPLRHRRRRSVLDVHHTILPLTDKLKVDVAALLVDSLEIPGMKFRVLAPADMVLHSAAHLFRNGDFSHAARDLLDLDNLLRQFAGEPGFWNLLIQRAKQHDLELPCFCGLRYAAKYYHTPLGAEVNEAMESWRPGRLRLRLLDYLVDRALLPRDMDQPDAGRDWAIALLAHWPVPRPRAMFTTLFWTKRIPRLNQKRQRAARGDLTNPEQRVPDRPA